MDLLVKALLWTAVVIAPGGVVLLPVLAARALRRRQADAVEATEIR